MGNCWTVPLQRGDLPFSFSHVAIGTQMWCRHLGPYRWWSKKLEGAWTSGRPTLRLLYKAKKIDFTPLNYCSVCYLHPTCILINTALTIDLHSATQLRCCLRGMCLDDLTFGLFNLYYHVFFLYSTQQHTKLFYLVIHFVIVLEFFLECKFCECIDHICFVHCLE